MTCTLQTCKLFSFFMFKFKLVVGLWTYCKCPRSPVCADEILFLSFFWQCDPPSDFVLKSCYRPSSSSSVTVWTASSWSFGVYSALNWAWFLLIIFLTWGVIIPLRQFSLTSPVRPADTTQVWLHMLGLKRTWGEEEENLKKVSLLHTDHFNKISGIYGTNISRTRTGITVCRQRNVSHWGNYTGWIAKDRVLIPEGLRISCQPC